MFNLMHLAGRQIAPNAQATLAAARAQRLGQLVVLHSSDDAESVRPARSFAALAGTLEPAAWVGPCRLVLVDETAQSVYAAARQVLDASQGSPWILNATGGNKPMSAGLMMLAGHPRVAAVIYRDLKKGWFRFVFDAVQGPRNEPIPADCPQLGWLLDPQASLQGWSLGSLVKCQLTHDSLQVQHNPLPADVQVDQWLAYGCQHPGRLHAFKPVLARQMSEGVAFEAMLGLLLQAAGCAQVLWSVKVKDSQGIDLVESDLLACHRDQIVLYNIKISGDGTGKSSQIKDAAKTAADLGGLSAKAMVVRPNWPNGLSTALFAKDLKVGLLRRDSLGGMADALLQPLGLQAHSTAQLERVRTLFATHARQCGDKAFPHPDSQSHVHALRAKV